MALDVQVSSEIIDFTKRYNLYMVTPQRSKLLPYICGEKLAGMAI